MLRILLHDGAQMLGSCCLHQDWYLLHLKALALHEGMLAWVSQYLAL